MAENDIIIRNNNIIIKTIVRKIQNIQMYFQFKFPCPGNWCGIPLANIYSIENKICYTFFFH